MLREALRTRRRSALGQLAMRGQEYVVSLKPCGRGMLLETLRYADEVVKAQGYFRDISRRQARSGDARAGAEALIDRKTAKFDPDEFHNRYVDALKELIAEKRKTKGEKIEAEEDESATAAAPTSST